MTSARPINIEVPQTEEDWMRITALKRKKLKKTLNIDEKIEIFRATLLEYNTVHDARGRFSSGSGGGASISASEDAKIEAFTDKVGYGGEHDLDTEKGVEAFHEARKDFLTDELGIPAETVVKIDGDILEYHNGTGTEGSYRLMFAMNLANGRPATAGISKHHMDDMKKRRPELLKNHGVDADYQKGALAWQRVSSKSFVKDREGRVRKNFEYTKAQLIKDGFSGMAKSLEMESITPYAKLMRGMPEAMGNKYKLSKGTSQAMIKGNPITSFSSQSGMPQQFMGRKGYMLRFDLNKSNVGNVFDSGRTHPRLRRESEFLFASKGKFEVSVDYQVSY